MKSSREPVLDNYPELKEVFRLKARIRTCLSVMVWILYAGFAMGYGFLHTVFNEKIAPGSHIPFALLYFVALIFIFIGLELLYLKIADSLEFTEIQVDAKKKGAKKEVYNYAN